MGLPRRTNEVTCSLFNHKACAPADSIDKNICYNGYFIPKGTTLISNVWAINRDSHTYGPDAHLFNPARYLDESTGQMKVVFRDAKDEGGRAFGFGRRICPGRHIATSMLTVQIALILWSMNIKGERGPRGEHVPINADGSLNDGLVV